MSVARERKNTGDVFHCKDYEFPLGTRTYIMGILNVTPDSFSDGGKYQEPEAAVERAWQMVEEGADIIDIGGESTRPGFIPLDGETESRRLVPVVERLAHDLKVPISIDTTKAVVAKRALEAGAHLINDIWGLQRDPDLAQVSAAFDAGVILMHNSDRCSYQDLMGDIIIFLCKSLEIAQGAGIKRENIALDPGIGFGKDLAQNLETLRRLQELRALGLPILLGTSRKSLVGKVLNLPVHDRVEGTAATVALGIAYGADFVRVHDVQAMKRVAVMTDAVVRGNLP
ncbi:MAG: dihydropteroate synthase [Treponema sp.]|jgi:dihydropteroate synthase|nr:dihydropteroate synthase [Treponema sp.]